MSVDVSKCRLAIEKITSDLSRSLGDNQLPFTSSDAGTEAVLTYKQLYYGTPEPLHAQIRELTFFTEGGDANMEDMFTNFLAAFLDVSTSTNPYYNYPCPVLLVDIDALNQTSTEQRRLLIHWADLKRVSCTHTCRNFMRLLMMLNWVPGENSMIIFEDYLFTDATLVKLHSRYFMDMPFSEDCDVEQFITYSQWIVFKQLGDPELPPQRRMNTVVRMQTSS
jgi:hypothetical protein